MKDKVIEILRFIKLSDKEIESLIEVPKNSDMGDYAFPCFILAKKMKKSPSEIAKDISSKIKKSDYFEKVGVVNAYVNFFVNRNKLAINVINDILKQKEKYGAGNHGKDKVMIEFSQANTHKAFHVGHIRGTALGESISRIMEFSGDKVTRVNYQGDIGMHVAKWLWCYTKYHAREKIENNESWFAKIYVEAVRRLNGAPELEREVEEINRKLDERKDKKILELWKETRKICLKSLESIYQELDTKFDAYFFESEVEKKGKEIAHELVKKKIAKFSEGATIIDFAEHGFPELAVWVLLRKDGTVLYSSKDIALAERKFKEFKIDKAIYVVGSEQALHIRQLFKTLELIKFGNGNLVYVPVTLVRLPTGKMSSRTGDNVLYADFRDELLEEAFEEINKRYPEINDKEKEKRSRAIALASIKYTMLKQDTNKVIVFDKKEALRFEGDTGPYLLYTYARARRILRKAKKAKKDIKIKEINEHEKALVTELSNFPEVVKHSYEQLSPNLIANYAYQLAQVFNEFYHNSKVIGSEEEGFRLALVDATSQVIKNALYLLGIPILDEM